MAVKFAEGERWYDNSPFTGRQWMCPVYMIKDKEQYFVIYRSEPEDYISKDKRERILKQLADNDGMYAKFHGPCENPFEFLRFVCRRKEEFRKSPRCLFDVMEGFTDFHGNLKGVSAVFKYRIYDRRILGNIKRIVKLIENKNFEEALLQIERCR